MTSPREATVAHPGMSYMPALDGVRAIAVVAVLAFHAAPRLCPGGFFGVDVFFVLSGYLITSVIVADRASARFSFRAFYLRRAQRLLPNLVAMVLGTLALFLLALPPSFAVPTARHALWVLANLSNIYIWQHVGNYWGNAAHSLAFLHTWSLAVEEQFYVVLPLLLVVRRLRAWIAPLALASVVASAAMATATHHATASFYLLPMRAWEPLLGALAALSPRPRLSRWIAPLCLLTLALAFRFVDEFLVVKPFEPMLVACAALGLVLGTTQDSRLSRVLGTAPLAWIGRLSYSLYLWHWPVIVVLRDRSKLTGTSEPAARLWGTAAGVALGVAAYYAIERPLRRRTLPRRRWLPILGVGFASVIALASFVIHRPVDRDPLHLFDPVELLGNLYTAGNAGELVRDRLGERYADVIFPQPTDRPADPWRTGGVVHAWGEPAPEIVVIGSSHALMYAHVLDELCRKHAVSIAFLAVDGTSAFIPSTTADTRAFPTAESLREFDAARLRFIAAWHPKAVFVIDRWSPYIATLESQVGALLAQLAPLTSEVVVFGPTPNLRFDNDLNLRELASWRLRRDHRLPQIDADDEQPIERALTRVATGNAHVLPIADLFPHGTGWMEGRAVFYADNNHLSEAGARRASARIEAEVVAAKALKRRQ